MRAPFSIHEALIQKFQLVDPLTREPIKDSALDILYDAMTKARGQAETMANLRDEIMADRIFSRQTNIEKLRQVVLELSGQAERLLRDAAARAGAVVERVRSGIAEPPIPEPGSSEAKYEEETRTTLRSLNDKQRRAAFAGALTRDDMVTIGAVLRSGVPSMVTGMSDTERELRRREWQMKRYPAELDRIDRLVRAIEAGERAGRAIDTFAKQLVDDATASQPLQRRAQG